MPDQSEPTITITVREHQRLKLAIEAKDQRIEKLEKEIAELRAKAGEPPEPQNVRPGGLGAA